MKETNQNTFRLCGLAAKRGNPGADTSGWEREIDERVYRLYPPSLNGKLRRAGGLTAAEIKVVEGERKG